MGDRLTRVGEETGVYVFYKTTVATKGQISHLLKEDVRDVERISESMISHGQGVHGCRMNSD